MQQILLCILIYLYLSLRHLDLFGNRNHYELLFALSLGRLSSNSIGLSRVSSSQFRSLCRWEQRILSLVFVLSLIFIRPNGLLKRKAL